MKATVVILLACTTVVLCAPQQDRAYSVSLSESIDQCAGELGILAEEAGKSFNMPVDTPGDCVTACVWKKIGLMGDDDKIDKSLMLKNVQDSFSQMRDVHIISEDTFINCVDEANASGNKCDVVSAYFKCLLRNLFHEK